MIRRVNFKEIAKKYWGIPGVAFEQKIASDGFLEPERMTYL